MRELRSILEEALGQLYRVEREVRPLGECRLFVVVDLSAGPELLVKVLPAHLSLALDVAQFERELLLLSDRLKHPQLVPLRGAGRAGAHVYHTRPFIEGTTLRAYLARQGELPLRQTVDILQDVLGGLAHAHTHEIVHGDLRPENVLVAAGRALVADAGVVGAVARCLPGGAAQLATAALCAPPYLPPERRDGPPRAEPRDDMFAVGVLAVEMLTGRPPEPESEPLEEIRSLPPWLGELVRRSLTAERAERWTDAGAALDSVTRRNG
jgi:serine/threonine protein kinase